VYSNFDRIVIDPRLRRAELEAHVSGPDAGRPHLGRYRVFSTAGTTGVRGLFVEDADEFAVWIGTSLRGLASWGLAEAQLQGRLRIAPGWSPPAPRRRRPTCAGASSRPSGWSRWTSTGPPRP
jgi:hypothetical protein